MPTNVLIAIPSKGRADDLCTMNWLKLSRFDVCIFVEPQEEEAYAAHHPETLKFILPENDQGLGYAKVQIQKYAREFGYSYIFKMDDDITGFYGRGKRPDAEVLAKQFDDMLEEVISTLVVMPDIVAIGFPYRWELYEVKKWVNINGRLQTAYLCETEHFYSDERISVFEDFHTYLKIRANNLSTLRYGALGIGCKPVGANPGGHQMFNRGQKALAEVELLREVHPALEFKQVEGKDWTIEPKIRGPFFNIKGL